VNIHQVEAVWANACALGQILLKGDNVCLIQSLS